MIFEQALRRELSFTAGAVFLVFFLFGIVHVDFATQQRTIKDSGSWFQQLLGAPSTVPT